MEAKNSQLSIWKLENQENQWYNLVWVQRHENQWSHGVINYRSEAKDLRTRRSNVWGQEQVDVLA